MLKREYDGDRLPVVSLANTSGQGKEAAAEQVREAATTIGFFYISDHGVPQDVIDAAFAANRAFHALPEERKLEVRLTRFHRGYQPFASSTLRASARFEPAQHPNQLESFFMRHELTPDDPDLLAGLPLQGPNLWPSGMPEFREAVTAYNSAVSALGHRLVELVALAIGERATFLDRYFTRPATSLRLIHYPPQPAAPEGVFGAAPHTDYGCLTILAQDDIGGLEVARRDGAWIAATPLPGTFVINIGDILARWTNDVFTSTPHRVINRSPDCDRYSIPFFFDPDLDAVIEPLAACVRLQPPALHEPILYRDYFAGRLDANYTTAAAPPEAAAIR